MLTDNDKAGKWIERIAEISGKVAEASKANVVQTVIATVISKNTDDYTVRLLSSPDDGSQDFNVYCKTNEAVQEGDSVFLYYIGDLTNAYIAMLVDGGNSGGGGEAASYNDLSNKPKINNVELLGNKSLEAIGVTGAIQTAINNLNLGDLAFVDTAHATYQPKGTVSKPTFTGTQATISMSGTPSGTVSKPTFSGTQGNISVNGTPSGSVSISKAASGTANYTPEGTVSQPTTTVTVNTTTVNSITDVGSLPAWTATVADETLTIGWSQGSLPTKGGNTTVATGIKSATTTQPTFTGTGARLEASFSGNSMNSTGTFTPAGSVSQPTFSGDTLSLSANYTPAGSVSQPTFTGTEETITVS